LFLARSLKAENTAIFVGSLGSKERKQLLISDSMPLFAPPRSLLFIRQGTLMTQEMDLGRLALTGDPTPVAEQVARNAGVNYGAFSVSENGVLVYRTGTELGGVRGANELVIVDRMDQQAKSLGPRAEYQEPLFSPDQQFLAFSRADQNTDIWIMDLARGTTSRFTFDPGIDDHPLWSPDGGRVVFSSTRDGEIANLYEKPSGGAGQEQLLLKTDRSKIPTDWSRDGRYIVYEEQAPKTGADLWILPTSGDKKPTEFLRTPFNEKQARFSPDGRWIAYDSNESGREEVYVQSFPQTGGKWQVSTEGGFQPVWRADGKELFYLSPVADNQFMAVDIQTAPADRVFKAGVPKKLFVHNVRTGAPGPAQGNQRNSFDVTKDGQHFVLNSTAAANTPGPDNNRFTITVVLNWAAGLKK
jgi:eukaryotic-like serine/threonine-protein kinase